MKLRAWALSAALAVSCCSSQGFSQPRTWPLVPDKNARQCSSPLLQSLYQATGLNRAHGADQQQRSVCKTWSVKPQFELVVSALRGSAVGQFDLVVGVWLPAQGVMQAALRRTMDEDATMDFEQLRLRIDTARYGLSKGVEAFGIDIYGGYQPNCGDGAIGASRDLYAFDGRNLTLVARDLILNSRTIIDGDRGRCSSPGETAADRPTVTQDMQMSIHMGSDTSHGLRDLMIAETLNRSDGGAKEVNRYRLQFDGTLYRRH